MEQHHHKFKQTYNNISGIAVGGNKNNKKRQYFQNIHRILIKWRQRREGTHKKNSSSLVLTWKLREIAVDAQAKQKINLI